VLQTYEKKQLCPPDPEPKGPNASMRSSLQHMHNTQYSTEHVRSTLFHQTHVKSCEQIELLVRLQCSTATAVQYKVYRYGILPCCKHLAASMCCFPAFTGLVTLLLATLHLTQQ
jgi:hypothetical protein